MTTQMIVRIDDDLKKHFNKLAQSEGKNSSQVVRELIESYIQEHDIGSYIDVLWDRVGEKLTEKGVSTAKIKKAIRETRAGKP